MCGFFLRATPVHVPELLDSDANYLRKISHRGPDASVLKIFGNCIIGFNRLAIRSIETGGQPYEGANGSFIACINGEVYNENDLRKKLLASKPEQKLPDGDMQIMAEYVAHFGASSLVEIDGMFAGFLYFKNLNKIVLIRDKAGEKPLFYCKSNDDFYVASEANALPNLRNEASLQELSTGHISGSETFYKGIFKLNPGSYCEVLLPNFHMQHHSYWDWPKYSSPNYQVAYSEVQSLIADSIKVSVSKQLVSDVPITCFLSGGLDSAVMLKFITQKIGHGIDTFTVNFQDSTFSEGKLAYQTAQFFDCSNNQIDLTSNDIVQLIPQVIDAMDLPIFDPACIGVFALSQAASNMGYKVAISGDGGDEIFRGYRIFSFTSYLSFMTRHPSLSKFALKLLIKLNFNRSKYLGVHTLAKRSLDVLSFPDSMVSAIALSPFAGSGMLGELISHVDARPRDYQSKSALDLEFENYYRTVILPEVYLVKADRMSMANSVEVRNPFLDSQMLNLVSNLTQVHLPGKREIMRGILGDEFPSEVMKAPKHGFGVPLSGALARMDEPEWNLDDLGVNTIQASAVWRQICDGDESLSHTAWALLVLNRFVSK